MTAPVPRPAEEPDREALLRAAAEAIARGNRIDPTLDAEVLYGAEAEDAVTAVLTLLFPDPSRDADDESCTCMGSAIGPHSHRPTPPAPGGGGTDLRGEVERLRAENETLKRWHDEVAANLTAALAARSDADQGAGA